MRIDRTLYISVHIPKTAGTSFKSSLVASIGSDYLFFDYNHSNAFSYLSLLGVAPEKLHKTWLLDKRFNYSTVEQIASSISPLTKFIHGHFPGRKYLVLSEFYKLNYMTWLRDPFDRMLSNYFFWIEQPDTVPDEFVRKIKREQWTVEKFCMHPYMRNYQSLWLRGLDIDVSFLLG